MTRYGSADVGFLIVSGLNVLGDMTNLDDNREAILEEVTALGDAWEAHAAVGVSRYTLNQNGFFNDAAGRSNAALLTPGTSKVLSFAPETNVLGAKMVTAQLVQADYTRMLERAALHKARASYQSYGQQDEMQIVFPLGAQAGDGDSTATSLDGLAQSTAGGVAVLQVTALDLDGGTSVTITLLDDADDTGTFGTLQAFTNVTAVGAERIEIAGTIERFTACDIAFNGTPNGSESVTFTVGLRRL